MSACRYCDAPIGFQRINGKWLPANADGSPHYCRNASRAIPDVNHKTGKTIRGAHYQPCCNECGSPPWEHCACSRLLHVEGAPR